MAKKIKKCFRSVTGDNFDPANCIREECSAWVKIDKLEGCSFILSAVTSIIQTIEVVNKEAAKQETENDINGKDNAQGGERGIDDTNAGGKEPVTSDTTEGNKQEKTKGDEVHEGDFDELIPTKDSSNLTSFHNGRPDEEIKNFSPIEDGKYKGDPA